LGAVDLSAAAGPALPLAARSAVAQAFNQGARRAAEGSAMAEPIIFPGEVEWSGENPGISLKTDPDGPFTALASFFRVVLSPHGQGHAMVVLRSPHEASGEQNFCLTDNEVLARYLVRNFVSHFGAWKGLPGLASMSYWRLDSVEAAGDPLREYSETARTGGLSVRMVWSGMGKPFCFAFPPAMSATGMHHMPTLFVGCDTARIEVNGQALPGQPVPRTVAGHEITTAMLAFSETWVRA
jgi:hypothetical protein